ncbi:MAG: Rne/Rng family ribonuclease [Firmicutes bacterium]|nr:Rne/Rng family ribonuclease [Candidatus Fermentithermobacillaceae bacterium]
MVREILVSEDKFETRVAIIEDGSLVEFYVERPTMHGLAGSIFLGKVENVLPGMQACFVDIGEDKNAFLYVDDAFLPGEDDEDLEPGRRKKAGRKTIGQVVKPGEEILVQVTKEAMGTKGPRVTRHVSLPGRYLVLMPTVSYVGVSHRIADSRERQRLKRMARALKPAGMGLIVRTVAEGKTENEIRADLEFLLKLWEKICAKAKTAKAPALIHHDLGLVFRIVRDEFNAQTARMLVDNARTYEKVLALLDAVAPELKDRVIYYRKKGTPLFSLYGVEEAVNSALSRQVWLKSGGYLVIDKTEALTVIDVNTGKYVGSHDLAETVFRTNMEACTEIAKQLRLRDIGGIIIIDFIDMTNPEHKNAVLRKLEEELRKDHTKTTVLGLTGLGLVEMTRKKVRQSLDEVLEKPCPTCHGKGRVLSEETVASRIRREILSVARTSSGEAILLEANPQVASILIGPGGSSLRELEKEAGKSIFIRGSEALGIEDVSLKPIGQKSEAEKKAVPVSPGDVLEVVIEEPHFSKPLDGIARVEGYVLDVEGAANLVGKKTLVQIVSCHRTHARAKVVGEGTVAENAR